MSNIIQLLPDNVANQIAAGEVIQRPSSAVKELLENAIDAQATEIKLIIKDSGKTLIQVIDNGIGMSESDARLAFERHATSKIRTAQDLFTLHSKGFRGEALASIAAISQVEMITKQANNQLGTKIRIEANKIVMQEPSMAQKGTSIAMKNLFFNIPARRNFLKSDNVEYRHILDEFYRVVLAHSEVHFHLINQKEEVFNLPSVNVRQRISHLFGNKINEKLLPCEEETELLKISGFICRPSGKKNKNMQYFFVNNRFIRNRYLHHAVISAYEGLLKEGEQPGYFIYLQIDPKHIDINIHPTKTEIKFDDEHTIYALLRSAIKHSLGQFNVVPSIDFTLNQQMQLPYHYKDKESKMPTYQVDLSYNPFDESKYKRVESSISFSKNKSPYWESLYSEIPSKINNFQQINTEILANEKLFDNNTEVYSQQVVLYFQKKYLVTYLKEKILIIYVNRAHQRILYERFIKKNTEQGITNQLLFPVEIPLNITEMEILKTQSEQLQNIGFVFDIQRDRVVFTGLPIGVDSVQVEEIIREIIFKVSEDIPNAEFSHSDFLAKMLSKAMAISTGQNLSVKEQEQIIKDLFSCQEPLLSPFGKKTYIEILTTEIDNKFK